MNVKRIHHVAYRCRDAKETVDWYRRVLGMDFTAAFAEDHVPSTRSHDPYMHVFLDAGMATCWRSSSCPTSPTWAATQHAGMGAAHRFRGRRTTLLGGEGSMSRTRASTSRPGEPRHLPVHLFLRPQRPPHRTRRKHRRPRRSIAELKRVAPEMLDEWSRTKKAPRHAAWLHELEFTGDIQ